MVGAVNPFTFKVIVNICIYFYFYFLIFIYLFIYLWLCWVLASVQGPSPAAASGGHSSSWCAGLSPSQPLPLRSTGSRCAGPAIVAHGPSRFAACGILPDQGPNPCPLQWQVDSQPLCHQGSPDICILIVIFLIVLDLFLQVFFSSLPFSCDLMINFSFVFGFLFLFCVCIYCRFLVCGYHEVLI